jgi:hypothetical protein
MTMLRVSPSPAAAATANHVSRPAVTPASVRVPAPRVSPSAAAACRAAGKGKEVLTGVVFQPFEEIKGELSLVPQTADKSLARQKFVDECEAAINEQIKYVSLPALLPLLTHQITLHPSSSFCSALLCSDSVVWFDSRLVYISAQYAEIR